MLVPMDTVSMSVMYSMPEMEVEIEDVEIVVPG